MGPVRKRTKLNEAPKASKEEKRSSLMASSVKSFMEDVSDSITDDKAIESLLVIRAEQRRLVKELIEADCEIKVARKLHDQQDRQLASLQYEQGHLVRQLERCRNFHTPLNEIVWSSTSS